MLLFRFSQESTPQKKAPHDSMRGFFYLVK